MEQVVHPKVTFEGGPEMARESEVRTFANDSSDIQLPTQVPQPRCLDADSAA